MFNSVYEIPIHIPELIDHHNPRHNNTGLDRYKRRSRCLRGKEKALQEFVEIKDPKFNLNKAECGLKANTGVSKFQRGFALFSTTTPDPSVNARRMICRRLRMSEERTSTTYQAPSSASTPQLGIRTGGAARISQAVRRPRDAIMSPREAVGNSANSASPTLDTTPSDAASTVELIDDGSFSNSTTLHREIAQSSLLRPPSPERSPNTIDELFRRTAMEHNRPAPPAFDMSMDQSSSSSD